jgi:hypothetical protein
MPVAGLLRRRGQFDLCPGAEAIHHAVGDLHDVSPALLCAGGEMPGRDLQVVQLRHLVRTRMNTDVARRLPLPATPVIDQGPRHRQVVAMPVRGLGPCSNAAGTKQ